MSTRLSRRLVLRGFGGMAIAMPMLEAIHDTAWAQNATPPKRFVTFFEHGGTLTNHTENVYAYDGFTDGTQEIQGMNGWRPVSTPGQALQLGPIHQPLADAGLTGDVNVVRGIDNVAGLR